jgi:hypothetical protein
MSGSTAFTPLLFPLLFACDSPLEVSLEGAPPAEADGPTSAPLPAGVATYETQPSALPPIAQTEPDWSFQLPGKAANPFGSVQRHASVAGEDLPRLRRRPALQRLGPSTHRPERAQDPTRDQAHTNQHQARRVIDHAHDN